MQGKFFRKTKTWHLLSANLSVILLKERYRSFILYKSTYKAECKYSIDNPQWPNEIRTARQSRVRVLAGAAFEQRAPMTRFYLQHLD